jgi:hypothetical protein
LLPDVVHTNFPKKIMRLIFRKLPRDTQLCCRMVCKGWKLNVERLPSIKMMLMLNLNHFERMIERKKLKNYQIEKQHPSLRENMRRLTVDWFIEVQEDLGMSERALFLGWDYLDRFLSLCNDVSRRSLQLFSICCLWLASKFEDSQYQSLATIANVCDNAYEIEEIKCAEKHVLNVLNWELYCPTIYTLACEYDECLKENLEETTRKRETSSMVNLICSICIYYSKYIFESFSLKEISSSLVFLSSFLLKELKEWPKCFVEKFGITFDQRIKDCIERVFVLYKEFMLISSQSEEKSSMYLKFRKEEHYFVSLHQFQSIQL